MPALRRVLSRRLLSRLVVLAALLAAAPLLAPTSAHAQQQEVPAEALAGPRNVILLIPDGYGPASATLARDFLRFGGRAASLVLDSLHVGSVRTFSSDSRVTDSAAAATAYATHTKTYNGAIALDTLRRPVATLLEAAEARGMATGLVATSRLTHATPAAFVAHVPSRSMENEIAAQAVTAGVEVLLGGGKRHFVPQGAPGSRRRDDRHLVQEAAAQGYAVVEDRAALREIAAPPVLGLFAASHMDYEVDRDTTAQPSLAEMTAKAIELLQGDEEGYFLMVEGSRIDHAGHSNDVTAHLHDILAFQDAAAAALDAARRDGRTLVVSVSDHETGGMTLGRNRDGRGIYSWEPSVVARVTGSHDAVLGRLATDSTAAPAQVVEARMGLDDLADAEIATLNRQYAARDFRGLNYTLADLVSRRALVGWTTTGHTAADVNVFAYGPGAERFGGNIDNTGIGRALAAALRFDLDALTAQMHAAMQEEGNASSSR